MPTLVYLVTGFLDSGKTSFIKETLNDPEFNNADETSLVISLEQGEVELDNDFLDAHNSYIEFLNSSVELSLDKMKELDGFYHPDQVFIEYNGMEAVTELVTRPLPENWVLVQIITTIDASTFTNYMMNMRSIIYEQIRYSDLIICNRCDEKTKKSVLRGNIKAVNHKAQIIYEGKDGTINQLKDDDLPFDLNADIIDISDDDYGLWYMDALDNPDKYNNKKIRIRGMFAETIPGYKQTFILGRRAMVCCANDTSVIGLTVTGVKIEELHLEEWVEVEGTLKTIDAEQGQKTVVLYASAVRRYQAPEDEYVYFN